MYTDFPCNFISVYLYLPSNASISWAAQDFFTFFSRGSGSTNWTFTRCIDSQLIFVHPGFSFGSTGVIKLPILRGYQTMQMSGSFEGVSLRLVHEVWVGNSS